MNYLGTLFILLITIVIHELAHVVSALLCGVKVKTFSIGFGKPYIQKKLFGINMRLSLWLFGGYTLLEGETSKISNGLMSQRYFKKLFILFSGCLMNIIAAFFCYIFVYKSIINGLIIDFNVIYALISKQDSILYYVVNQYDINNLWVLQFTIFNMTCGICNLFPIPGLDGGMSILFLFEKLMTLEKFIKFINLLSWIGIIFSFILQIIIIIKVW